MSTWQQPDEFCATNLLQLFLDLFELVDVKHLIFLKHFSGGFVHLGFKMADKTLDDIVAQILKQDTQSRLQASHDFQMYMSDEDSLLVCENFDRLVDGLVSWVNCSNFKVRFAYITMLCFKINNNFSST